MQTNNTQFLEVYDNNNACVSTSTTSHGVTTTNPCGSYTSNIAQGGSDADTNYDAAMQGITALMPTPGNGTNKTGDTPQEILFIVTDGVEDEDVSGNRQESTMTGTKDYCTPLKNKGIKIAILYTEYFPLPTVPVITINISRHSSRASARLCKIALRRDLCTRWAWARTSQPPCPNCFNWPWPRPT